jgi:hypothetical protein
VESQGELLVICVFFIDFDPDHIGALHIFKMDFDQQKPIGWNWVLNVGDMAFLLSGNSMATCCSSGRLVKGNTVYFLKNFRADDGDWCIYDLEEQTMEIARVHDRQHLVLMHTKPHKTLLD